MIFTKIPKNFKPIETTGCFLECNGKILLIHRQDAKPYGNKWDLPYGKVEKDEEVIDSCVREIAEETGIKVNRNELKYLSKFYVRYCLPDKDFISHYYKTELDEYPLVKLEAKEHKDCRWVTPKEALKMNLIDDLNNTIKVFYNLEE